jgi:hypothetical protein
MRGARIAPTAPQSGFAATLGLVVLLAVFWSMTPVAVASTQPSGTIDFTQAGSGPFDPGYFSGAVLSEGSFVGYVQGDEALIGPVAGDLEDKFTDISVSLAPAAQGTAVYTLTAIASSGVPLASTFRTVTQDEGDPLTGPFGYVTLELSGVSKKARSFRISNSFVGSSYPHITQIEFGVAEISWSR